MKLLEWGGKKLVRILVLGGKRCRQRKRMQGQVSENEVLSYNNANLKRPTFENLSPVTEPFTIKSVFVTRSAWLHFESSWGISAFYIHTPLHIQSQHVKSTHIMHVLFNKARCSPIQWNIYRWCMHGIQCGDFTYISATKRRHHRCWVCDCVYDMWTYYKQCRTKKAHSDYSLCLQMVILIYLTWWMWCMQIGALCQCRVCAPTIHITVYNYVRTYMETQCNFFVLFHTCIITKLLRTLGINNTWPKLFLNYGVLNKEIKYIKEWRNIDWRIW